MQLSRIKPWDFYANDLEEKRLKLIKDYNEHGKAFLTQGKLVKEGKLEFIIPQKQIVG
jgi:hypothetical protein